MTLARVFGFPALALLLTSPAAAESVDEVVSRYTNARGGLAAWRAIETMEWSGSYATFSRSAPFKLLWQRPGSYRFEGESLGGSFLWAQDSEGPWWIFNTLEIASPARTEEPYKSLLARQAEFEPPLFDWQAKGHKVELVGPGDIDGTLTVDLKVTLKSGAEEIWHLDTKTGLEVAIDSTTWDFTQTDKPMRKRAFLMEWKKVGGLMLPHRIEEEYGARFALMLVESVTLNPKSDASRFVMPKPPTTEEKPAATP